MNIMKRCNRPGCTNYISTSKTYCDEHKDHNYKQYERIRTSTEEGRQYKRFYDTKAWKELRYQVLLEAGFICEMCKRNEATVADHIIPTLVRWDLRLERDNIQALCVSCHNQKTAADKNKYNI